jgi:hypothetical protein
MKQGSRKNKLGRTKSTKVPFLGSTEDLTAVAPGSSRERQDNLRDKLRKFFVRRPTVDSLVKKGIWKDEPVFGCHLSALCHFDGSTVPKFVQQVIQLIESKQENMKADGIYRASGNLSQIQKIRCQVINHFYCRVKEWKITIFLLEIGGSVQLGHFGNRRRRSCIDRLPEALFS